MTTQRPKIICEIGLNHLGKKKYFYKYLDYLSSKNIYAITIQVIKDSFFKNSKFKNFKLDLDVISEFIDSIKKSKKKIGIATNDTEKIDFCEEKKVDFYKVINADLRDFKLMNKLMKIKNKSIFLSTGMSSFKQIDFVLKKFNSKRIKLIHTSFGKKIEEINFERIKQLKDDFKLPVCYGNHSPHLETISSSVYYNPNSIFFYVKLNNKLNFPDNEHAVKVKDIGKVLKKIFLNFNIKRKNLK
jgi:sialic acid synthase SpsE